MATQLYDRYGNPVPPRRAPIGPVEILLLLLTIVMVGIIGATYFGIDPRPLPQLAPATAVIAPQRPASRPASAPVARPAATPIPGICQDQACADAAYQAAVEAAEQPAVVHPDNVIVPVVIQERPAAERSAPPPAGEAPIAEPVTGPVDIQGTHQCRHGQVWIDGAGCKNPPSNKGSKTR